MTKTRLTAAERSEEVLQAAVVAFGANGYAGTKTDEIARLAGVSQPYVIRLFGTKQQLFLATMHRVCDQIESAFRRAGAREATLSSLGGAYNELIPERELLVVLLHGFAASSDPVIGEAVRERFGRIHHAVGELTGATAEEVTRFMATGMLLTVMAAMQVTGENAISCEWAAELLSSLGNPDEPPAS
jgi:AcrR family transcriptional regulator